MTQAISATSEAKVSKLEDKKRTKEAEKNDGNQQTQGELDQLDGEITQMRAEPQNQNAQAPQGKEAGNNNKQQDSVPV